VVRPKTLCGAILEHAGDLPVFAVKQSKGGRPKFRDGVKGGIEGAIVKWVMRPYRLPRALHLEVDLKELMSCSLARCGISPTCSSVLTMGVRKKSMIDDRAAS
jgi:hypothetical protein